MELKIYSQKQELRGVFSPSDSSNWDHAIQEDNVLSLSFTNYEAIRFDVNDYVDILGQRFWLMEEYTPRQVSTVEWAYDCKFYGIESLVKRALMLKTVDSELDPVFSLTAPAREHLVLVVENINRTFDTTIWKVGECVASENITIDYNGTYCNEALKLIAESVNTEYWMEGTTVNITRCEHSAEVTLGYGNGLISLERASAENVKFFTRLFPIGSSRNIDRERYGHTRLQLPGGIRFIEQNTQYGIIEHFEADTFSHIYPRRTGTIEAVRSEQKTGEDGNPFTIYYFKDPDLNFDPNEYELPGLVKQVSFQSGELDGRDFEVNFDSVGKEFEIITQYPYDDEMQIPGGTLIPKKGDKYILWNIRMPDEYYPLAEQEYLEAVEAFLEERRYDTSVYKATTDYIDLSKRGIVLSVGLRVRLESGEYFPGSGFRSSRITRLTRKVNNPFAAEIEISDVLSKGIMSKLEDAISENTHYIRENIIALPDIIKSWESTKPGDTNLLSALRTFLEISNSTDALRLESDKKYLRKDIEDTASETIFFDNGVVARKKEDINLNISVSSALTEGEEESGISPAMQERVSSSVNTLGSLDNVSDSADTAPDGSVIVMRAGNWTPETSVPGSAILVDLSLPASELWSLFTSNMEGRFIGAYGAKQFELNVSWDSIGTKVEISHENGLFTEIIILEKGSSGITKGEEYIEYITI